MSVGETLSHARRQRGLSLADVSAETRIRASLIAAMEADDFDACGGAVYARGHIRSIAKVLGVDPEPLVADYDGSHVVELPTVAETVSPQPHDPDLARTERSRPNWSAAMAAALVAICIFAVVGLVVSRSGSSNGGKTPAAHAATTPDTHHTTAPPASPPPTSVAEIPAAKATMEVRALTNQTWLQVTTAHGSRLFYGILPAGEHKVFSSRHGLNFVIGNAPAVDVVINGHDLGSPPSQGSVARGTIAPGADTIQQA